MSRLTGRGAGVLAGAVVLLAAGLLLAYREMAVLGGAGVLVVAIAAAWSAAPPPVAVQRLITPRRVRRGEPAAVATDVLGLDRSRRLLRLTELIGEPGGPLLALHDPVELPVRAGVPARVTAALPTGRRGIFTVGPLLAERSDPFGLWSVRRRTGGADRFTVWPRWHPVTRLPAGRSAELEGDRDLVDAGSITFHGLRGYVPGDDLRHVHWRTSARIGELMVRTHVDAALARQVVVLDDRAGSYATPDAFEEAVEVTASLLVATVDSGHRIVLLVAGDPGEELPVPSVEAGLDRLAAVRLRDEAGLDARTRLRLREGGDALLYVTGEKASLDLLAEVRARYRTIAAAVVGPEPAAGPRTGGTAVIAPGAAGLVAQLQERAWNTAPAR
ncbi:DUF58 domain-containing protein [Hamadaea tsunoensis]|uniref:DUF58 domain-containing protein n=1 Tax=Hamadaea tsunoensis TaxID=53368 RepID=UPI00040180D2|nr:DUF58 domain-containing protein [Hamadaea tsunoensis]